ncbi:MAG: ribonuclease HII [Pyrinomonadaceae bacterium]|nr:ribonuclease HII [Pyrinomonadaceae bacterium]
MLSDEQNETGAGAGQVKEELHTDSNSQTSPALVELLQLPLSVLKERFLDDRAVLPRGLLAALERDGRRGVRELAKKIRARRRKNLKEAQRLRKILRFETELWAEGFERIAGVDEAGMAPLAGPVVAAAVILPKDYKLRGLNDSKKIMDSAKREEMAAQIKRDALSWAVGYAEIDDIDSLNIYHAGLLAMRRAVLALTVEPDYLLVDARKIPDCHCPQRGIIRGDLLSASIAAASIIAKTTRDAVMKELDRQFPGYGLASHKGYPTPAHCRALKELGATAIHRRSFSRVREVLGLDPVQTELFDEDEESARQERAVAADN